MNIFNIIICIQISIITLSFATGSQSNLELDHNAIILIDRNYLNFEKKNINLKNEKTRNEQYVLKDFPDETPKNLSDIIFNILENKMGIFPSTISIAEKDYTNNVNIVFKKLNINKTELIEMFQQGNLEKILPLPEYGSTFSDSSGLWSWRYDWIILKTEKKDNFSIYLLYNIYIQTEGGTWKSAACILIPYITHDNTVSLHESEIQNKNNNIAHIACTKTLK